MRKFWVFALLSGSLNLNLEMLYLKKSILLFCNKILHYDSHKISAYLIYLMNYMLDEVINVYSTFKMFSVVNGFPKIAFSEIKILKFSQHTLKIPLIDFKSLCKISVI